MQATEPSTVAAIEAARARVLGRIADACARSGRDPADVQLVAVSKTVPVERLRAAVAAGLTALGENRVQEAEPKVAALPTVEWHLVGHLQANKVARALELFAVIESVDSVELAIRLDRLAGRIAGPPRTVYLQVNVDDDPDKTGFPMSDIERDLERLAALGHLELRGLMTVGRLVADAEAARPTFARLAALSARLRARVPALGAGLSMGMSDDLDVAVEEGATVVRIGRALFGNRPAA
jgi:PLP dependent protein